MSETGDPTKDALIAAARAKGMSVPGDVAGMPTGGELTQVAPGIDPDLSRQLGNWLLNRLMPNARSLAVGEPQAPMAALPETPGKVPSTEDPRPERAALEALQVAPAMPGPAIGAKMLGPALAGAEKLAPALAKAIPGQSMVNTGLATAGVGGAMAPDPAQAAEGQEVPIGERPQTGEWWRTRRAPPPQMGQFTPPTMSPQELAPYQDPEWKPPKGWKGTQETRQQGGPFDEGPVAHAKRVADLREQRNLREKRRQDATDAKTAVARKEHEVAFGREMEAYEKEQARIDKEDEAYKEANANFRRKHPQLAAALPTIMGAAMSTMPYMGRVGMQRFNNVLVKDLDKAIERAQKAAEKTIPEGTSKLARTQLKKDITAERKGAVTDLETRLDPKAPAGLTGSVDPSLAKTSIAGGTIGGAEGGIFPYEMDFGLPIDSPDRAEMSDPHNWALRAATGGLPGGLMGFTGAKLPTPNQPRIPDTARAQGLIKRLTPPAAASRKTKSVVQATTPQDQLAAIEQAMGLK